jgi:hypothetical protein
MTKKDFVTAWLLATVSSGESVAALEWHIDHAEQVWEYLQKQYEGEDE